MKKFFTLILVLVGICSAQAALIDFETANSDWQFIQDGQTNYWTIGSAAGSASAGSNALYITNNGDYGYNNNSHSLSWAYIPISVTSSSSYYISFSWKGTGESSYDYLSVYLFPIGTLPTAGSSNTYGATALVEQLCGTSDWQSFSVSTQELSTGIYNLCFMWRNDGSAGEMPIAIDDVNIEIPIVQNQLTYQLLYSDSTATIISCAQSYDGTLSIPNTITYEGTTYSVTSIGYSAFQNCSSLTSITIPNSVTRIGSRAFSSCTSLTSITIPNSVTSIGYDAFYDCIFTKDNFVNNSSLDAEENDFWGASIGDTKIDGLLIRNDTVIYCQKYVTSVTIPNSVTSIGERAFYNCSALTSITIPNSVTSIGSEAFRNCSALTSITIPNSVQSIGNHAFAYCSALTSITIPNSVTSIGSSAFSGCSSLTSVTIPNSVTNFDGYIFSYCSALKSVTLPDNMTSIRYGMFSECVSLDSITIPNSVTSIESDAFEYCSSLTSITIPNSVTSIGDYAFSRCSGLTSVTIPNSVTSIGDYAFSRCSGLTSVTIPNSVTSIEDYAFYSCENLASITFAYDTYCTIGASAFESCKNLRTIYNNSYLMSFTTGSTEQGYVAYYAYNISSSLNYQGDFVFDNGGDIPTLVAYHGNATSLTLPNSYNGNPYHLGTNFLVSKSLYDNYNYDYTYDIYDNYGESTTIYVSVNDEVQSIKVPASVISLAPFAFSGETAYGSYNVTGNVHLNIQSVQFDRNSSITKIPSSAFYNCSYLQEILLPDSLITIGSYAFYGCNDLVSITIPDNVTSIGNNAFQYCYSLISINLPDNMTNIGEYAFYHCNSLETINLPNTLTHIGQRAFYSTKIKEICIPDKISIEPFHDINNLENYSVRTTHSMYVSEDGILFNKKKNSLVAFPSGRAAIHYNVPNTIDSIAEYAFSPTNLVSVTVPQNVKFVDSYAFGSMLYVLFESNQPTKIQSNALYSPSFILVNDTTPYKQAWTQYSSKIKPIKDAIVSVDVTAKNSEADLYNEVTKRNPKNEYKLAEVLDLTISGSINSYDLMIMRNKMINLRILDLSNADIKANSYEYYTGFSTEDNMLKEHSFRNLYSIKLPKTLIQINNALQDCSSLQYAEFNNPHIGNNNLYSYANCHLVLNEGVSSIAEGAFESTYIKSISLPSTLTTISKNAFKNCSQLSAITFKDGLQSINDYAFYNTNLSTISLPSTLQRIGSYAFQHAKVINLYIPASIEHIGEYAFAGEYNSYYSYYDKPGTLAKMTIEQESKLKTIDTKAFYYNPRLDSISFPKRIKTIGESAFENCYALRSAIIHSDSLVSIGKSAFMNCNKLRTLSIHSNNLQTLPSKLAYGCDSLHQLSLDLPLLITIPTEAFAECYNLGTVIIPENITDIQSNAFYRSDMDSLIFNPNLKSIGEYAFACVNRLNYIKLPTGLETIADRAFYGCYDLKEIRIASSVRTIGNYAFSSCSNVNRVYTYTVLPTSINQDTYSCWRSADLYVPNTSYYNYYWNTQWSQFLNLVEFDEPYDYFYVENDEDYIPDGVIDGNPDVDIEGGSGLVVEGDSTQNLGTVTLTGEPGDWASILAGCNLNVDTLILQLKVTGHQWHFFGFPFEIKISDIFTEGNFVIYEYDGAIRAERDTTGWKKLPTGQDCLYPGHGYIFQFDFAVDGYFSIKLNKPNFCKLVELINLFIYPASNPHNQSWNYVSNPLLAYYDINDLNYTGPITFWDELLETYQTYRPGDDEYYISPYEAFFLQNANLHDNFALFFDRNKAMTKKQRDERSNSKHHLPAKKTDEPARERFLINLLISDGTYSDQTRVVINSNASLDYELGVDAAKFLSTEKVPQLFSYDADHAMCAINERPMDNGTVQLGIQLPKSGTYSISAARMDTTFYLFDKQENITHDFQQGDYYFDAKSGLNDQRFELVRTPKRVPTAIEDINTTTITPTADGLIVEGNDYIQIYSMTGVMMAEGQLSGLVQLPNGVYVVVCNGNATKHTVQ